MKNCYEDLTNLSDTLYNLCTEIVDIIVQHTSGLFTARRIFNKLSVQQTALTDVDDAVLEMCRRNVEANRHLRYSSAESVFVRELDWLQSDLRAGF